MSISLKGNLDYKVKIDVPNVIELISETFDNVLNYMFPEMLVFGGALRDIIAGFGLHHDLDIATSRSEGKEFIHYLETSSKWMEECVITQYKEQAKTMKDNISNIVSPHSMENGMLDLNRDFSGNIRSKPSSYGNIRDVRTFVNSSGHKLQIIISKSDLFTSKEAPPINIVKTVDFICCGLIMDIDGNVYEVIEGARNDCIKRILRINKNADIKLCNLNKRIKKFTARGWKSEINLTKIKRKQIRLEKAAKGKAKRLEKQQSKFPLNYVQIYKLQDGKIQMVVNTSKMRTFEHYSNSPNRTLDVFYRIFRDCHLTKEINNCQVEVSHNDNNHIIISTYGRNIEIISDLKNALSHREYKFLPDQKYETGTGNKEPSEEISKPMDLPYRHGGKIHPYLKERGVVSYETDPGMYTFLETPSYNADLSNVASAASTISPVPTASAEFMVPEVGPIMAEELAEVPKEMKIKEIPKTKLSENPLKKSKVNSNGFVTIEGDSWGYMAEGSAKDPRKEMKLGVIMPKKEVDVALRTIFGKEHATFENLARSEALKKKMVNVLYGGSTELATPKKKRYRDLTMADNNEVESGPLPNNDKIELTKGCNDLKVTKEENDKLTVKVKTPLSGITAEEVLEEEELEEEELLNKTEKAKLAKYSALNLEYTASYTGR